MPALTGDMLFEVVKKKSATAGSLDGWGWRELKVLPVAWFHGLARILSKVEELGVWPDGLLDAYIAMIPKVDGDATPLGQRPLGVLPVVYRIWASARMLQLEPWFRSWVPSCVFSAGGGRSSVEAWFTTSIDIEEVLFRVMFMFLLLMLLSLLILLIVGFWIGCLVFWVCRVGSGMLILSIILWLGLGLSFLLGWSSPGLGMGGFLRVVH